VNRVRESATLQLGLLPFSLKRLLNLAATAVLLCGLTVTTVLVVLTATPEGCANSGVVCGAAGGLAASFGVFLFGFGLVAVVASQVVRGYLMEVARDYRDAPESDAYVDDIVGDVTAGRTATGVAPRIIVGESGAGRSTLLAQLARDLVAASWVPVIVSLRVGAPFTGFTGLARAAFLDAIDLEIASQEEGERIWRRVCGSGRLVLLVDDLHRVDSWDGLRVRAAFEHVREQGYALIATSRPHGVSRALSQWATGMGHVPLTQAVDFVLSAAQARDPGGKPEDADRAWVAQWIEDGKLTDNPYYVSVLAQLAGVGVLDHARLTGHAKQVDELRGSLLDLLIGAYTDGTLAPDDHSTMTERKQALAHIELAAYDALLTGERASLDPTVPGMAAALEAGLLVIERDETARVRHAVLQDYLASRAVGDGPSWRTLLVTRSQGTDVLTTLRFWAARADRVERAVAVYDALLTQSAQLGDARALRYVITAAAVSRGADLPTKDGEQRRTDNQLAVAFADAWRFGELSDRRIAVELVAKLRHRDRFSTLGICAVDPDYMVRWYAAQGLCGRLLDDRATSDDLDVATFRSLVEPFFDAATGVADAIRNRQEDPSEIDDWDERIRPLMVLGWVLPVLGVLAPDAELRTAVWESFAKMAYLFGGHAPSDEHLLGVPDAADFAGVTTQRGPEATIAQGLKTAATLAVSVAVTDASNVFVLAERLSRFYDDTTFWYSRIVLLQGMAELALTLHEVSACAPNRQDAAIAVGLASRTEQMIERAAVTPALDTQPGAGRHPFTVATARLCREALNRAKTESDPGVARANLRRSVWADEAEVVSASGHELDPVAVRLLGAITVLLNLIERGDHEQRRSLPVRPDLPACLVRGEDPTRLLDGAGESACGCSFGLCNKRPPLSRDAVREMSGAFCRRAQSVAGHEVPGWPTRVKTSEARRFWREMEQRAQR
jgi:hypothetical protein